MYIYRCRILRAVDGDTVWAEVDLGVDVRHNLSLRLEGINAPEMGAPGGPEAKAHLESLVNGKTLFLRTVKDRREKYGRYRAILLYDPGDGDHASINQMMVEAGHAQSVDYR
ncbi:MAG: thermonuclease family protein [Actinomycetota bacterium]|nr:thermonuclease family protein [Actinomycetota bacterium]